MSYALFLGCTIPARSRNYEASARKVAQRLGFPLEDIAEFMCCGFPIKASNIHDSEIMGAYNLALAEKYGMDLCVLCSSCGSALTEVGHHLRNNSEALSRINDSLAPAGLRYLGKARVRHFARILHEEVGQEAIKNKISRRLDGLSVAVHYGCHYLKPSEIYDGFDDVEYPRTIDSLVALTGANLVDYPGKKRCCGGPVLPVDENVAMAIARGKLEELSQEGAEVLCLVCPFCSVMYDGNQKSIESAFGKSYGIPVLYLTQLLGLAMGIDPKELGFAMNVVKTKDLLERISG
jgi:heterodisulfide reductase subunit B